ncbi:MAG: DinB family protein [Acidobacteriaceae bacterium]|nr:DinB family protein [Acidobacteriaceae bacterium]
MSGSESAALRRMLLDGMRGHYAHVEFESVVEDFPAELRGVKPAGAPHTAWQLLEHMRLAQHDILEFSREPDYQSPKWPEGYWPSTGAPPDTKAWDASVRAFQKDAREFNKLVQDSQKDLFQPFGHGDGQTLLREALLITAHNSYHLGQLVYLKKILTKKG